MNQEQLIHLHIPKTAGSSLNRMLSGAYGTMNPTTGRFIHYNSTLSLIRDRKRRQRPVILGHIHYEAVQVLAPSRKVITFLRDPVARTISAFEFMKSRPDVWLGKLAQGSIAEFLTHPQVSGHLRDGQVRLLGATMNLRKLYADLASGRITREQYESRIWDMATTPMDDAGLAVAKERLESLDFVGFTETFDEDVRALFSMLGKPCPELVRANQTPSQFRKRERYSEEELELVASFNQLDIQLYQFARGLRARPGSPA
jgi:hypothetical protein